jgi:hypothetical protein
MNPYYKKSKLEQLIARAERDLEQGDIHRAIARYEGAFRGRPHNAQLHDRVAKLYLEIGDSVRAGRHWYLKDNLAPKELGCVQAFERSFGNSPTHIMRNLMYLEGSRINLEALSEEARGRLRRLVIGAAEEQGQLPRFLWCFRKHFFEQK